MKRAFDEIIANLKTTIADYAYFTDFSKVYKNVANEKDDLIKLNSLINSGEKFDDLFISLIHSNPEVLKTIPLLIAVRENKIVIQDSSIGETQYFFDKYNGSDKAYLIFMNKTGLRDLIANGKITNLIDYAVGVEVGLDSNARKNRTGKSMELLVESYLKSVPDLKVLSQVTGDDIEKEFGFTGLDDIELSDNDGTKKAEKIYDFACLYDGVLFLIETNFYGSGGSKLNETARSYQELAERLKHVKKCHFVWITDGIGWRTAKGNLLESYEHQENLLTLKDLELGYFLKMIDDYTNK